MSRLRDKVDRQSSSSECERESAPTKVPTCTSNWDNNHLNQLQTTAVLSMAYTPMDIINSFKIFRLSYDYEVLIDERVKKISDHLFSCMPSGLQALNFDDFSSVPSKTATSLLYDMYDGTWNEKSFRVPPLPGPPDSKDEYWRESFRVNGDLFSKRLMYMTWLREQDLPVSEHLFQELFQHFSAMFGLDAIGAPGVKCETLRIGDVKVISTPDLVYYDFPKCSHDQGSKIFVVCEVNKDALKNDEEPSPPKARRYEEGGQQQICHLSSELIGQHGGDLLAHFPCKSSIQYGLFGFIVQCTSITFTHLDCSEIDFEQIRRGDPSFPPGTGPVIRFSQPYNFLKAEDRRHIIPPLLKLGFIKSYM
ncbi:unnamed protein product [Mytilus edulis]|uniref:Uncharacterized protein n=1 Tax=Mytilus edulis TaxID=6550 RepID=A0A8S3VCW8_MYTED|nr:unnamed protein product [Mytilus edulis]